MPGFILTLVQVYMGILFKDLLLYSFKKKKTFIQTHFQKSPHEHKKKLLARLKAEFFRLFNIQHPHVSENDAHSDAKAKLLVFTIYKVLQKVLKYSLHANERPKRTGLQLRLSDCKNA